jgi:hypothetical protein
MGLSFRAAGYDKRAENESHPSDTNGSPRHTAKTKEKLARS